MRPKNKYDPGSLLPSLLTAVILILAGIELNRVAWGTGVWLGEYSLKWALGFFGFILVSLGLVAVTLTAARSPHKLDPLKNGLILLRARLGILRWLLGVGFLLAPVWLFQYTSYGVVFIGTGIRLVVWILSVLGLAFALGRDGSLLAWRNLLGASLLSDTLICAAIPLAGVSTYPFSLGWSEGNRLWDYSILFGSDRYIFPSDQRLTPFLDVGRQLSGGLPFLFPGLTIFQERLWLGLMGILPYVLLGLCVYYVPKSKPDVLWLLAGLWGFLFLRQGPIHTPLLLERGGCGACLEASALAFDTAHCCGRVFCCCQPLHMDICASHVGGNALACCCPDAERSHLRTGLVAGDRTCTGRLDRWLLPSTVDRFDRRDGECLRYTGRRIGGSAAAVVVSPAAEQHL